MEGGMENYFVTLNNINVNDHAEKKNGLTYLSWAWAWAEVKKLHPTATYTIYEAENGCFYHTDGRTCWVKTGVTINDIEHIEYLPVMDYRNASITREKVTSFDVNKAIQRSLTKAVARHGLGLYIYAGEDLPEVEQELAPVQQPVQPTQVEPLLCSDCGCIINGCSINGKEYSASKIAQNAVNKYGRRLCAACSQNAAKAENKGE
jgi:hypothetical protein